MYSTCSVIYKFVVSHMSTYDTVQIVKKNTIENIVPIVISVKHLFEQKHSPLLKDLLLCLKEIMQVCDACPYMHMYNCALRTCIKAA